MCFRVDVANRLSWRIFVRINQCLLVLGLNGVRLNILPAIFSPDWFNVDSATRAYSYLDVVHGLLTNKNTANYI